jgi:1-acyl-sn-glycerol-3-phosphate acyltransferase
LSAPRPQNTLFAYHLFKWLVVSPTLHIAFHLHIEGAERVPLKGPLLLVANHASFFDPPILANCARRPVAFMAKEELFTVPLLSSVIRMYGAFPVKRGTGDRGALRAALSALENDWAVGIFINGTRTDDGRIPTPQLGAALIAQKAGVPLLPVAIAGSGKILPRGSRLPRLARLSVAFGDLLPPPTSGDRTALQETTQTCTTAIHRLLDLLP